MPQLGSRQLSLHCAVTRDRAAAAADGVLPAVVVNRAKPNSLVSTVWSTMLADFLPWPADNC
jgi:hypothetical protein